MRRASVALAGALSMIAAAATAEEVISQWAEPPMGGLVAGNRDPSLPQPVVLQSEEDEPSETAGCQGCHHCQRLVCGNRCRPQVCRFDHPADCTACVTDRYCPHGCSPVTGHCRMVNESGGWLCDGLGCDVQGRPTFGPADVFRLGWWGVETDGSPHKIGEYQDLSSSPFWDLDGIWTDRQRTLDFTLTGLDNEANYARAYFYGGPNLTARLEYDRFLRHLDHDPLSVFDLDSGAPAASDNEVGEDLNVGEDYAIRVQQLDARFRGQLTQNLKWRLNVWGLRKSGERQANAMAHCFDLDPAAGNQNNTCHVLSQRQRIDWQTIEFQPVLEARLGQAVVEYSRTMRVFGQSDELVDRTYTRFDFSPAAGTAGPPFIYALVPENFTQVDRLKISRPLGQANSLYANVYVGNTQNRFRDTNRSFFGYDLRVTNRQIDGLTWTAYSKMDNQHNELPTDLLTSPPLGIGAGNPAQFEPGSLRHPVDYDRWRFGLKGRWQANPLDPYWFTGGYEYFELARDFVTYDTRLGTFTQEDTKRHQFNIAPYARLTSTMNAYVRYRAAFIEDPLIGVRENDGRLNTNQPEQEHLVEIGGTWSPASNFVASAQFGMENTWHHSPFANFDEDNYPITCTVWYAPTQRLSLTGGYAYFSNWIDQDITIGFRDVVTETTQWDYAGKNQLFSIGANYAWTPCTQLVCGFEWDRGTNIFSVPPSPAGADWSLLPFLSDVIVETTRINAGFDHQISPATDCYFRYVLFDYQDDAATFNSGTAHMFLAGLTWIH